MSQFHTMQPEQPLGDDIPAALEYRPISLLAVFTLVLGVASSLSLAGPILLAVPALTVLLGALAWRSIAQSGGTLVGQKAILWGLALAVFFAAMSVGRSTTRRALAIRDSREIAETFIWLLQNNQPEKAHQLQLLESFRQPAGTPLQYHYRTTSNDYEALRIFVDAPLIHALLTLGKKAQVRYYATEDLSESAGRMYIVQLFTVTFEQQGKRQTFFARITTRRDIDLETGILSWAIDNYESGVKPFESGK